LLLAARRKPDPDYEARNARRRAATRGQTVEPGKWLVERMRDAGGHDCPACGATMVRRTEHTPSLDRTDNTAGYTKLNTAVICRRCNTHKGTMTGAELLRLAHYVLAAEERLER
jgi:hypothetical protein